MSADVDLFQRALGLEEPWEVEEVKFDAERRRLDLRVDFRKGARFPCPECGRAGCPVHDTESHTWRHLNFFEHEAYLTARVPRVELLRARRQAGDGAVGAGRGLTSRCCSRRW